MKTVRHTSGDLVARCGDPADRMWIVRKGCLQLKDASGTVVGTFEPRQVAGPSQPASGSVTCDPIGNALHEVKDIDDTDSNDAHILHHLGDHLPLGTLHHWEHPSVGEKALVEDTTRRFDVVAASSSS